jgi:dGTPase
MQSLRDARRHQPKPRPDQRRESQRDRDRVLYSSAFRRLGGVTQVVAAQDEGYLVHNRLTHSLKVAQIGLRIAEMLERQAADSASLNAHIQSRGGLDPNVVEAAGLAHDLGHPPFGHIAEEELNLAIKAEKAIKAGVDEGFEGNAQSFRIVTKLSRISRGPIGLDLTRATLNAILKYPWYRSRSHWDKWGAYPSEADDFEWAQSASGLPVGKRTLEAEIMDWSDDITYAVHDVEDFYRVGLIPLGQYVRDRSMRQDFAERVHAGWKSKKIGLNRPSVVQLIAAADVTLGLFPLEERFIGTDDDRALLRGYTSGLISRYVQATTVTATGLSLRPDAVIQVELLKMLTKDHVVDNPLLSTQQHGQRRLVRDLYAAFRSAIDRKDTSLFPTRLRANAEIAVGGPIPARCRLVADVVASMTEVQAIQTHRRLLGYDFGPLIDPALM